LVPLSVVLANGGAPAVLADVLHSVVLADGGAPEVLAFAPCSCTPGIRSQLRAGGDKLTKQPVTIGKAVRRHSLGSLLCPSRGLGHSDDQDATGRLSKDDKALDAFTASRRDNEDGKTLPKESEGVKRREDLPFLHKRSKGRDPTSRGLTSRGLTSRGLTFKRVGVDLDP
jgi:hypothetical protein